MTYIGKSKGRLEGLEKARGRARYAADYSAKNMLYVKLLRSPHAHAKILNIDLSMVPDDVHVFTAKDLVINNVQDILEDQPLLAEEKVRFLGEPIAILAADSLKKAEESLQKIQVTYELLPVVTDCAMAMKEGCVRVHDHTINDVMNFTHEKGSISKGFAEADLILSDSFHMPIQDHGYMEPEACFATMDENNHLLLYVSTQNVFHDQRMVCDITGRDPSTVHVMAATIGGGFGGKDGNTAQLYPALVTHKTGLPSKLVFTREESLQCSYKRHSADLTVRMGLKNDGTIVAFEGIGFLDTGAYGGLGPAVLSALMEHFAGPYSIEHVRVEGHLCYTNKPVAHAMRGFGAPQACFGTEILLSRAARKLGMDQIAIRKKNALIKGLTAGLGNEMLHDIDYIGALELIEESDFWKNQKDNTDPYIAYGIAGGHQSSGMGKNIPDDAAVRIEKRGDHYKVYCGLVDLGQGNTTSLHAVAAEALHASEEDVELIMADTALTLDCGSVAGSRSTFIAGNAILDAVSALKKELADPTKDHDSITVTGHASFPQGRETFSIAGFPHALFSFVVQAVKLRIDPLTGQIRLLDIIASTETGKVINPLGMEGQVQGGIGMSVGYSLSETCEFDQGRLKNDSFSTYLMPTAMDVPPIKSLYVDAFEEVGPMGAKGCAEVSTVPMPAAIASAIEGVTGCQIHSMPFDPETILDQLMSQ
ncbi:MAG: xanthine dehydrogenase family protein molybdopterin-binding subunit [Eubacteriales bacterium]|nr:xanthine dehydrogenase family protein molybdopterin-binding subunit [Eubacteriales bacterium]